MSKKESLQTLLRHFLTKSKSSNSFCVLSALNGQPDLKSKQENWASHLWYEHLMNICSYLFMQAFWNFCHEWFSKHNVMHMNVHEKQIKRCTNTFEVTLWLLSDGCLQILCFIIHSSFSHCQQTSTGEKKKKKHNTKPNSKLPGNLSSHFPLAPLGNDVSWVSF